MEIEARIKQASPQAIRLWCPWWYRPSSFLLGITLPILILFSLADTSNTLSDARLFYSNIDMYWGIAFVLFLATMCRIFEAPQVLEFFSLIRRSLLSRAHGRQQSTPIGSPKNRIAEMFFSEKFDWLLMAIFIVSHLIFFRGFFTNPSLIIGVLGGNVELKHSFETIPGITTWTQVGTLLAAIRGFRWAGVLPGNRIKLISWFHLIFFGVLFVRAILWSERLALIEGVIPFILCALPKIGIKLGKPGRFALQWVPLVAPILLLFVFVGFEALRSWQSVSGMHSNLFSFGWKRLFTYYFEAMNTGSAVLHSIGFYNGTTLPLSPDAYESVYEGLYQEGMLDKEFNNTSGIWFFLATAGNLFVWPALVLLGMFIGLSYQYFRNGKLFGLIFPVNAIMLIEWIRIYYSPLNPRVLPTTLFLILFLIWAATVPGRTRIHQDKKNRLNLLKGNDRIKHEPL